MRMCCVGNRDSLRSQRSVSRSTRTASELGPECARTETWHWSRISARAAQLESTQEASAGQWVTSVQAARQRLALGMLLHQRLAAGASAHVDTDVVWMVGQHIVGAAPLMFSAARSTIDISCNRLSADNDNSKGSDVATILRQENGFHIGGCAVVRDRQMYRDVHYAEFWVLQLGAGMIIGVAQKAFDPADETGHRFPTTAPPRIRSQCSPEADRYACQRPAETTQLH